MGSEKIKRGLLPTIGVLIVLLIAMGSVNALIINQFNASGTGVISTSATMTNITPTTDPDVCTPVCLNYTVNVTLEVSMQGDDILVINFKPVFDLSSVDASDITITSNGNFGNQWYVVVDNSQGDILIYRNFSTGPVLPANTTWIKVTITNKAICAPTAIGNYSAGVEVQTSAGGLKEDNFSAWINVTGAGPVKEFVVWYWDGDLHPDIPDNLTVSCPANGATNPIPINISAVDACGNLNTTANLFVNITEYYSGTFLGNGTFAGGWLNLTVNISYTGWNRIFVENTTTGVTGMSNDFWLDPAQLGSFQWDTIMSPKWINYPFAIYIEAYDVCGNFKYDYDSSADSLSSSPFNDVVPTSIGFSGGIFDGDVTIEGNSTVCGMLPLEYNLTVTNGSMSVSATSNNFTVTRIPVNATLSEVSVSPTVVPADNTSFALIAITVRDDSGAFIPGVNVRVSSDRGATDFFTNSSGRQLGNATDMTDSMGQVSFKVSSHTNGTANITVEVWNGCEWVQIALVQVTFTAQVANPGTSLIYVWDGTDWVKSADNGLLANGSDPNYYIVKVVARDNEGNPVENVNVTLFPNSTNVMVEPANNITDANGTATFKVYSTEWGWFSINATVNGQMIYEGPIEVFFNPVLIVDSIWFEEIACSNYETPADGVSNIRVRVHVVDLSGKDVPNAYVELSSNKAQDSITPASLLTDSDGWAQYFYIATTNPATSNITAVAYTTLDYYSATSSNSSYGLYAGWVSNVTDPANSSVWANKYNVEINGDYGTVFVEIRDAYNSTISNVNVTLVSSRPDYDTITPSYEYTNCDGQATFTVKSRKAGTSTFTAYVDGVEVGSVNITFYAPVSGYYIYRWYAEDYLLNLEEKNTTRVWMQIFYGTTPVMDQVVKVESLSNCGDTIIDVIEPSNPVTDEEGWISFNITTDTAVRPYFSEGGSCVPTDYNNEIRLVVKIGENYLEFNDVTLDYDNPLEVVTVIEHGPKEAPTIEQLCGLNETDYPWFNWIRVQAPWYVVLDDDEFYLKEFKLLLKDGEEYSMLDDHSAIGPEGCEYDNSYTIYYEDFETSDGGWYAGGSFSTWEWGQPLQHESQHVAMSNLQDKGWATGLGNNYHPAESSFLYSKEINISGISGTIYASWGASISFESGDYYKIYYSIDSGPWEIYNMGDPINVNNNSTIRFRFQVDADEDTLTDEGLYIDWFKLIYLELGDDPSLCYGNGYFWVDAELGGLLQDETAYDFVVKAVYCKDTPNGEYCLEAPLSDVYTFKIDTVGPDIRLAKSSFNCSEAPYGYFYDFLGVDLTNDDFYVNLEGFSASYDYFFTLPYNSDWSKVTWDNKYINVHFDHISLSGGDYILLWSGYADWTGGTNNVPIEWTAEVPVANITYNYWYEFPLWLTYAGWDDGYYYEIWKTWNDYFGSVHGDLWFKFPVSKDEVCWLSYEQNGYIFYYDTYPPNDGFNIDMITYGTGVKIYLWNDATGSWDDITDQSTITSEGFTLPQLEPGTYRLRIVATDVVGNANHLETTFTVQECSARFTCDNLNVEPTTIVEGQNITASATITNVGEVASNYTAGLYIDGDLVDTESSPFDIYPGEEWNVSFVYQFDEPGVYNVGIDTCPAVPVTVLSAANISVDYSVYPTTLCVMSDITVNVTVTNTGEQGVDYTVDLVVDGEVVDSTTVFVPGLSSVDLQFTYTMTEEGVHTVTVNTLPATDVTVTGPGVSISNLQVDPLTGDAPLNITVSAEIANLGLCNVSINYTADLKVNGVIVDTQLLQLDPYESVPVVFDYTLAYPGTYFVTIDGLEGVEVNVTGTISPGDSDGDGWNDTLETLIASYYPDFNPATDTPTEDDIINAVFGAVQAYFGTTDDAERAAIFDDVSELIIAYFSNF